MLQVNLFSCQDGKSNFWDIFCSLASLVSRVLYCPVCLPCESCLVSLFSCLVSLFFWSYLVSSFSPLLSLVSHKKYTFSNVAGKSLLLPRWQGQSAVGVQPRRDEGLSRQPQKVVFSSKPQLLSWQQHRAGAWPWLPATTSCSWRSATPTSPLRDGDLATTTPLASEDSIIGCKINLVMFSACWCSFVLATRVS